MREFPSGLGAILSDEAYAIGLIRIGPFKLDGSNYAVCTAAHDYGYNGITYSAQSGLVKMDAPRLSPSVDREVYKLHFLDPSYLLRERLENDSYGTPIEVVAAVTRPRLYSTSTIASVVPQFDAPGAAVNFYSIVAYRGILDSYTYNISPEGEVILEISGTSPMGPLGLTRALLTSPNLLRERYPGDTSYDQVSEGSVQSTLKWGRSPWWAKE